MISVHISAAMSLDGYLDDRSSERLILSSQEDFKDMYACRAICDAILVGAGTIRKDNPSLLFHDHNLIVQRLQRNQTPELAKVTITESGELDAEAKFFTGDTRKIVICPEAKVPSVRERLGSIATVLGLEVIEPRTILALLESVGISSLFVEGGTTILTQFISSGHFDDIRLAIAPFFVGDEQSPKFVRTAPFLHGKSNRLRPTKVRLLGDTTVINLENLDGRGDG